ncbi:MAG: SEC-C domain-containing protein [Myxococcales bacterium]|nr:SEC-C domain-containing protein [Myxococcales bacterium]
MPITEDPERLARVAGELGAAVREARPGVRVRLPVIQPADAAGLVMVLHAQLDEAIEERSREAAADGLHIACSAGCSSCCVSPLLVTEGEAVTVAEWLKLDANKAIRQQFFAAYPAWKRGIGDSAAALERARTDEERREAAMLFKRRAVMCAFNRDGLCTIYAPRPARCRRALALDTNAACGPDGDGVVKYFEHPRTEMTFEEQETMRAALHHALKPNGDLEMLCSAVQRLLGASISRNEPCPCGSGQKYKKCCAV